MTGRAGLRTPIARLTVFVLGAAVIFVGLLRVAGELELGDRYRVDVIAPTAVQLTAGADVRRAGVTIGRVERVSSRAGTAVLALALEAAEGPVHRDARVRVRTKTLVGESYVDLDPGTSSSGVLPDGATLPLPRVAPSVQLDEILSTFPPARRARLRRLLSDAATGFGRGRSLGATLEGAAATVSEAAPVTAVLAAQRDQVAGLVRDFGSVFRGLGEQEQDLRRLVTRARVVARAFAANDRAVRRSLRALPPTLTTARRTTGRLAAVGERGLPVLTDLRVTLDTLAPVLRSVPRASTATLRALRRLRDVSPVLRRASIALQRTAPTLTATVPGLDAVLRQVRPLVRHIGPYADEAGAMAAVLRSGGSPVDATSHLARPKVILSDTVLTGLSKSDREVLGILLDTGVAQLSEGGLPVANATRARGTNGHPAPGTAAAPQPSSGVYHWVAADPSTLTATPRRRSRPHSNGGQP